MSLLLVAVAANVGLLVALLLRGSSNRNFANDVRENLDTVQKELASGLKTHSDTLVTSLNRTGGAQVERLDAMTKQVKEMQAAGHAREVAGRVVQVRERSAGGVVGAPQTF
jgi:hypothetical protein